MKKKCRSEVPNGTGGDARKGAISDMPADELHDREGGDRRVSPELLLVRNVRGPKDWVVAYFRYLRGLVRLGGQIEFVDVDQMFDNVPASPLTG
ncbi:hypothetical protein TCAP_05942 [Tolypocladium capitatum]|uniref:Uncharacterized protein n=1 Tax=Tolypocladium capitatum TaxID=45235 RepID=A0A2K3Q9F5_9HYPO|nr:hypothetical protein TCAP_05942 [Tolypocladium capitatum]